MLPGFVVLIVKRRLSRPRRNNVKSRFLRVVGGHLTNVRVRIAAGKTLECASAESRRSYHTFARLRLSKKLVN